MILQNIVFPRYAVDEKEIYIRGAGDFKQSGILGNVRQGEVVCTDTYMNAFDIGVWKKYADITELSLVFRYSGKGTIQIFWEKENCEAVCLTERVIESCGSKKGKMQYCFRDFSKWEEGILYFKFYADRDSVIDAWFETENIKKREIKISTVICTYKRKEQLEKLLDTIRNIKTEENCKLSEWLRTIVVDNASELEDLYGEGITVYHNPNTGGSGGFTRGMKETVKNLPEFHTTHVVLMDDDVILQSESILRLYALLTYIRSEYEQEVIAGRMFRLDRKQVQYTAVEIWNRGDIRHIGWNQDMTDRNCLWSMNENAGGEYSGWWFACFTIEFVKENDPLPFFLHCDDVEYGLRHGGTPIILNGIQVWHETYEYRQSPVIAYYDYRNSLIVNKIYNFLDVDKQRQDFMQRVADAHNRCDYLLEYFFIRAFLDYRRGMKWFMKKDNVIINTFLIKKKNACRYINLIRRKIVFLQKERM